MDRVISMSPTSLLLALVGASLLYLASTIVYRLFFHPLSKVPGPRINAISRIPFAVHLYKGTTGANVVKLHQRYGEAVRLSPDQVSFISGETAWQDIYGFRTGKHRGLPNMPKNPNWYPPAPNGGTTILMGNDEDHTRYRKVFAHAFSERALVNQEVIVQKYVDLLNDQLKEQSAKTPVQDISIWFTWITFDTIADLTFGESWGCLRDMDDKYVAVINGSASAFRIHYITRYWPFLKYLGNLIIDTTSSATRKEFGVWIKDRTVKRVEMDTKRPDFMTEILKHNGEKGAELTTHEMANNNSTLIAAGSETTASLLSAVVYLLLKNPSVMQKLKDEVRGRWKKYDDITLTEVNEAPYLLAVLSEGLRYFPPVPTGFERQVPKGGSVVSGYYMPEGTGVSVSSLPLGRREAYFHEAASFIPERWLGKDERFAKDKRDLVQPFNVGPRNCLGKNLAYAEMRLILAKLIWTFDLELDPRCEQWESACTVETIWIKPPLWVKMKEVVRD